jgi:hypothetical protein
MELAQNSVQWLNLVLAVLIFPVLVSKSLLISKMGPRETGDQGGS